MNSFFYLGVLFNKFLDGMIVIVILVSLNEAGSVKTMTEIF